jgi:nucleoside-diphosphate-sugar epimerase
LKIFITGSSGFLGSHIHERIKNVHTIYELKSDLLDYDKVTKELIDFDPDIILHLAARTEVEKSFYEQTTFSEINYVGTVNLIEASLKLNNLKKFIFASTMEVYGWQPISDEILKYNRPLKHVAFDENTIPNPNAPYAVAKYACEKYLEYAHRSFNFPFIAIRQTNCYGRKDNDFFVTEQIITQMIKNQKEINLGYSNPYRNFIYVDDMLDVWETVINSENKDLIGKIFTIGPDHPIQISEYVDKIAYMLGWQGKVNWNTKPKRFGEIYWLNSNHNLISRITGWSPKISLEIGLKKTIDIWNQKLND